jgi:hypothetical protein
VPAILEDRDFDFFTTIQAAVVVVVMQGSFLTLPGYSIPHSFVRKADWTSVDGF